jgi:hypothetical protein
MWINKKYKLEFKGSYSRLNGERVFNLTSGKKTYTFESWQMAKKLGWVRK